MALARWQANITDEAGNVLPVAQITVRQEVGGSPLASLFSDRAGTTPLGNPFNADADGFAAFHTAGGAYRIDATLNGITRTWRYVGVGLAQEVDGAQAGVSFIFDSTTADADPGDGELRLNNATLASVTTVFIDNLSATGINVAPWLTSWDDFGATSGRGFVQIVNADQSGFFLATVTGTIVDGTGYRKVSVTPVATAGSFTPNVPVFVSFVGNGLGSGDVTGPAGGVVDNEVTLYNGTTGKAIKGSGKLTTNIGAGLQTIWVPASAMTPRITNPAGVGTLDSGSNDLTFSTLDFDQTTAEFAHFPVAFPKSWNKSTVQFQPFWMSSGGSAAQTAILTLAGVAISNDDVLNASFGTAQSSSDALIATSDLHVGPLSAAITIGGTPADDDLVMFQIARDISDTLASDLRLIGIKILYSTSVNTDV